MNIDAVIKRFEEFCKRLPPHKILMPTEIVLKCLKYLRDHHADECNEDVLIMACTNMIKGEYSPIFILEAVKIYREKSHACCD
jgi:hypothetical protein